MHTPDRYCCFPPSDLYSAVGSTPYNLKSFCNYSKRFVKDVLVVCRSTTDHVEMAFNNENFEPDKESEEGSSPTQHRIYLAKTTKTDKNDNSWLMDVRNERDWNRLIDPEAIIQFNVEVLVTV